MESIVKLNDDYSFQLNYVIYYAIKQTFGRVTDEEGMEGRRTDNGGTS